MIRTLFWEKEMTDELEKAFIDYNNKFDCYPDEYENADPSGYNPEEFAWIIRDCIKKNMEFGEYNPTYYNSRVPRKIRTKW